MHLGTMLVLIGFSLTLTSPSPAHPASARMVSYYREAQTSCPTAESRAEPAMMDQLVLTPSGLQYVDLAIGGGPWPEPGQLLALHYTGWLADSCEPFDSSRAQGVPFEFPLGEGRVIRGWDEGVATMRVGGERLLIVPPELGYGATGIGPIPPDATLVFAVELLDAR